MFISLTPNQSQETGPCKGTLVLTVAGSWVLPKNEEASAKLKGINSEEISSFLWVSASLPIKGGREKKKREGAEIQLSGLLGSPTP